MSGSTRTSTSLGEPRWFFGMLATVKAAAADTAGRYTLVEIVAPPHLGTPLHVHHGEDGGSTSSRAR